MWWIGSCIKQAGFVMSNSTPKDDVLLDIKGLKIQGFSDERWHDIVKGVDLKLCRGQIMGLIGESGAGKSTLGLAAMGYTQPGCRIIGGSIHIDGVDLAQLPDKQKRDYWGNRMTYVAQSAAASFNPAHRLIEQTTRSTIRFGIPAALSVSLTRGRKILSKHLYMSADPPVRSVPDNLHHSRRRAELYAASSAPLPSMPAYISRSAQDPTHGCRYRSLVLDHIR